MNFSHCDHDEKYLTLHDCIAERAYFENGKLGFEFNDGFWISPDHPESDLSNLVRTDFSKVEYTLEDGADYDVTVYVFKKNIFKKTPTEVYSFYLGTILQGEIDNILSSSAKNIFIGGNNRIKTATAILLSAVSDKRITVISDKDVERSTAVGVIRIYEHKNSK